MSRSAIILVVDRLGTGALGPYGATWLDTPNFDALAAESLLLENVLADSPDLQRAYRALWTGQHVLCNVAETVEQPLASELADAGIAASLITDEPLVAEHPLAESFHERVQLSPADPQACAAAIEQTQLAALFSAAIDQLERQRSDFLLWIHARGMQGPWDAPLELRRSLAGEDDPDPPDDVAAPSLLLPENYDPDELLGLVQSYAGQVLLLDACLGALLDAARAHPRRNELLVMVASPRGFPLGEHLVVGDVQSDLYGELLQVPMLIWRGDGAGAAARDQALVQPSDLAATLRQWFGRPPVHAHSLLPLTQAPSANWPRDGAICIAESQRAIRTPAWSLREWNAGEKEQTANPRFELFSKPDDRWEVNDVASRCPQIVKQLTAVLEEYEQAATTGKIDELAKLPEELLSGIA